MTLHVAPDDESKFKIGDRLTIAGQSVPYPFNRMTYEVCEIEPGLVRLKIVEPRR